MSVPAPKVGEVLRYAFLWKDEASQGIEEATKWRPSAVVITIDMGDGAVDLVVAPITHHPAPNAVTVPIPIATGKRLGLDGERQWIVVSDLNRFRWPGPDIRPVPGEGVVMGELPAKLYEEVRAALAELFAARKAHVTKRTE